MKKIRHICSNCGEQFAYNKSKMQQVFNIGCRAVGDVFYCSECVANWRERNGENFSEQYCKEREMFEKYWNAEYTERG